MARRIGPQEMEDIALGAAVLGTGGGGDPYIGKLMAIHALRERGPVTMVSIGAIRDDDLVVPTAMMGAPTVMVEKLPRGDELLRAFQALSAYLGRRPQYTVSIEAGGLNSTMPFTVAAHTGVPIVDADGMGRAFPEIQMVIPTIFGVRATPMAIADEKGNSAILDTVDNKWTETLARTVCIDMGCTAMIALYPLTGAQVKEAMVPGTLSRAERIGRSIRDAQVQHRDVVAAVRAESGGVVVFRGKVSDVRRRTERGFARGEATMRGLDGDAGSELVVHFQNEHLVALRNGEIVVSVPDLITILDAETGHPITTEGLRYGFRVVVLGIPCDPRWRTPRGLELVGPRYFGYDIEYMPVEERFRGL
jgi:DUF917 family protein